MQHIKTYLYPTTIYTKSGTDRDQSGGEEETSSRRRRRSRWDPQPESNDQSGGDGESGSGTRKRKSRWADAEEEVPLFVYIMVGYR